MASQRQAWELSFFLLILFYVGMLPQKIQAQYFGQNKVQYQNFNFKVLKTDHFDIYYYPQEEKATQQAAFMAERWYARHSRILDHKLNGRQPLIFYASGPQFRETNIISGQIGEGTGGVTEALRRRIVIPFAGPLAESDHVIGHELVHAFQYDIMGLSGGAGSMVSPSAARLPLWFIEGMAEFLSLGPIDPHTAMWMRDAAKSMKKLPKISQLENPEYFPYRWGQALLAYISGKYGDDKIALLLTTSARTGDIKRAIKSVLGVSSDTLSAQWHRALHAAYDPIAKKTEKPSKYGKEIISKKKGGGDLNIAPVLSPDGKNIIFFSEKSLFAIDLFLADAKTGKIKKNIVHNELDPHLQSLEFIYSSGAWSPDGSRIAFSAVSSGRPILSILDIKRDKVTDEIPFKDLGEILNPAWSPDGRYIAFSALVGGLSDLYIYDLQAKKLERLTDDLYADLQPSWSPDGKRLVWVTDRYSTQLSDLKYGNYRLGIYDVDTQKMTQVPGFTTGKQINPQWSKDGEDIYFISDYTGISNIYRVNLISGNLYQLTNFYTGASGITALSPAMSVAADKNQMAFSIYEDSKYNIYTVDSLQTLPEKQINPGGASPLAVKLIDPPAFPEENMKPVITKTDTSETDTSKTDTLKEMVKVVPDTAIQLSGPVAGESSPEVLPPDYRVSDRLIESLDDPNIGLKGALDSKTTKYRPKLSLAYVGQPYVAAGVDRFGALLGGGASLYFTDMLGDHNLSTMLQVQSTGGFTDFAGAVAYQNLTHRWNWAVVAEQIPYIYQTFASGYAMLPDSSIAYVEQQYRISQINRDLSFVTAYPFNRASRVEFSAGLQNVTYSQKIRTDYYDVNTGNRISDKTMDLGAPSALYQANLGLAYVYDNSFFGATSPILGQRFRFEISPSVGTIQYYTAMADIRKYVMPIRPFTLAARLLHYGRYGAGAEDGRFYDLFIGYQSLVRGYDYNSLTTADGSIVNRLFGSKIAVGNFELRFPLLGLFGIGEGFYGFLPIEAGGFYDAGVAWTNADKASFLGGNLQPVRSFGPFIRVNLLGYVIGEIDYVKPVDRPDKGWYWEFSFTPGF